MWIFRRARIFTLFGDRIVFCLFTLIAIFETLFFLWYQQNSPKDAKSSKKSVGGEKQVVVGAANLKKSKQGEPEDISQQTSFDASK